MRVRIINIGEGDATLYKEMTEEQFKFLHQIQEELNLSKLNDSWCPTLVVERLRENEERSKDE